MRSEAMVRGTLDVVLIGAFALGLVALTGCGSSGSGGSGGGGGTTPTGALASGGAATVYAIQSTESGAGASILGFGIAAATDPSPTQTLVTPSTFVASAVATDSTGQLYVGGYTTTTGDAQILVYAEGATGTAAPTRTITVDPNAGIAIVSMAIDGSGNIYATGSNESGNVAVVPAGANGTVTPTTVLSSTSLTEPIAIAVDNTGKIYVSNIGETSGQILVFAAGATGRDAPVETISTVTATSTTATVFYGLAVDESGNIFATQDSGVVDSSENITSETAAVVEFSEGATGVATPTKTISVASSGITEGGGLRLDSVGNVYLITQAATNNQYLYSLLGFGPNASGSVAPGLSITPSALSDPSTQIAVH